MQDDNAHSKTTDVAPLKGYALRLWEMLEEVQAQVELPEDLDDAVASLLWRGVRRAVAKGQLIAIAKGIYAEDRHDVG